MESKGSKRGWGDSSAYELIDQGKKEQQTIIKQDRPQPNAMAMPSNLMSTAASTGPSK